MTSIRGFIQGSGVSIIGDSITYGPSTSTSSLGCINISTCFTSTQARTYEFGINIVFTGSVSTSTTNFVFKMVKIQ